MATFVSQRACVLEPLQCMGAIEACSPRNGPFSLHDLEALSNFADASILFEEVIFLDTHLPRIRFADAQKSSAQRAEAFLREGKRWQFFNCDHHIREYPNSDLVTKLGAVRPDPEFERIHLGGKVYRQRRIPHPVLGMLDWSTFLYLDKVNAAAARLGAPVIHGASGSRSTTLAVGHCNPGLAMDFITDYDQALRQRRLVSRVANYRSTFHYAPFLLSAVLNQLGGNEPARVLEVIVQMRERITKNYRALCEELVIAPASKADRIEKEISRLLSQLACEDRPVPAPAGPVLRTLVSVVKPFVALVKDVPTGLPSSSLATVATGLNTVASLSDPGLNQLRDYEVYSALQFFNRFHESRMDARVFFERLRRVFGPLAFTLDELNAYFAGQPIEEIYGARRRVQPATPPSH